MLRKECVRMGEQKYTSSSPEAVKKRLEYGRQYRLTHKEQIQLSQRRYYLTHKEQLTQRGKEYNLSERGKEASLRHYKKRWEKIHPNQKFEERRRRHHFNNFTSVLQIDGITFAQDKQKYDTLMKEADEVYNSLSRWPNGQIRLEGEEGLGNKQEIREYHRLIKRASRFLRIVKVASLKKSEEVKAMVNDGNERS